jgi:hypothetical protein
MLRTWPILALLTVLLAPGWAGADASPRWKAVLVAGDDSITVFDNAVTRIGELLAERGVDQQRSLTSDSFVATPERPIATSRTIEAALADLAIGGFDRCLVYLTSHGDMDGVLLKREDRQPRRLTPNRLGRILDRHCAEKPTVIVVSACHSGVFIAGATMAPNRVILTAARDDLTSFGCGPRFELTYFDECVIDAWPKAKMWRDLFRATESCVRLREAETGQKPSLPQSYFGEAVTDLAMP